MLKIAIGVTLLVGFAFYMKPLLFKYMLKYAVFIIQMSFDDHERYLNATKMQAETEWRLHQFEMQYNKAICKPTLERGKVAWLTAMTNDDFVIGKTVPVIFTF